MKNTFCFILLLIALSGIAQEPTTTANGFGNIEYYLIDSLPLEELTAYDNHLLDSALSLYHKAKSDKDRLGALMILQSSMMHEDWSKYNFLIKQKAEKKLKEKLDADSKQFYLKIVGDAYNNMGFICQAKGKDNQALVHHKEAFKIYKKAGNESGLASVFINVGFIYENHGNITKALEYYYNCLKLYKKIGNQKGTAEAINNIGNIYAEQGNHIEALIWFEQNLELCEKIGNKQGVAIALSNIGSIYYKHLGRIPEAIKFLKRSLKIAQEIGNETGEATLLENIGAAYFADGKLEEALDYYERNLLLHEKNEQLRGISHANLSIGNVFLEKGDYKLAHKHGRKSLTLANELGYPDITWAAAKLLSTVYKKNGDFKKGLEMHELYILMRDSIQNESIAKDVIKAEANYQLEIKEQELKLKEKDISLLQKDKKIKNYFVYALVLFILLTLSVLFIWFRGYRQKKKIFEIQIRHQLELYIKELDLLKTELSDMESKEYEEIESLYANELSKREIDVLKELVKAKTNQEIADSLFISLSTVKSHLMNIYTKLDVKNRSQATKKIKDLRQNNRNSY